MNDKTITEEMLKEYAKAGKLYGKCAKCGQWTSTHDENTRVKSFLYGCRIDGVWFCDLCLPCQYSIFND